MDTKINNLRNAPKRRRAVSIQIIGDYIERAVIILQGLLLIPLYLHFIGDRMYGMWLASGGVLGWFGFMELGVGSVLIQRVSRAYGKKNYEDVGNLFINGLVIYGGLFLVFCLLIFGISFFIPQIFGANKGDEASILRTCFQLAGIAASAEFLSNCLRGFASSIFRPLFNVICGALFRIIGLLCIVFLLYKGYGLWSIAIGLMVYAIPILVLNGLYSIYLVRKLGTTLKIQKNIILEYFQLTPALFANKISYSIVKNIEPTIIAIMYKPEIVPAFVITKRVALMLGHLIQVINASIFPGLAHYIETANKDKIIEMVFKLITIVVSASLIGFATYFALNKAFINIWVGSDQYLGQGITFFIALALIVITINQLFWHMITAAGDIIYPSILSVFEQVIRLILMVGLIYNIGLIGLPIGMLITNVILCWFYCQRLEHKMQLSLFNNINWLKSIIYLATIFSTAFFISSTIQFPTTWITFGLYSVLAFISLLLISVLFDLSFRKIIKEQFGLIK